MKKKKKRKSYCEIILGQKALMSEEGIFRILSSIFYVLLSNRPEHSADFQNVFFFRGLFKITRLRM